MNVMGFAFLLFEMAAFYFRPVIVANWRHTQHTAAIEWVDFLFGWTILGWVAVLICAFVDKPALQGGI